LRLVATRFDVERAVLASSLPAICRHLVHVLCVKVDAQAGIILSIYQPSLRDLARETGWSRRTIIRKLAVLEKQGWIIRDRPPPELARREHRRTRYTILIPNPQARDSTAPGLAPGSPVARDGTPPGLVPAEPEARDSTAPGSSVSSRSSEPELVVIIETIQKRDGVTVDQAWARRVLEQITGGREIRHPAGYVRRVILAAPPGTYSPTPQPPAYRDLFPSPEGKA
jgi:hypothetical protein